MGRIGRRKTRTTYGSFTPDVCSFSEVQPFDTTAFHADDVLAWRGMNHSCSAAFAEVAVQHVA